MAIILLNLLKQDLSNTFLGAFNADFASAKASPVIIINRSGTGSSSSCSRRGGGTSSGSDSASSCGSSKILSGTDKYKLGTIAGVRVGECNLGTRVSKFKVSVRVGKHKFGPGLVDANWGPGPGPGDQVKGWEPENTNTLSYILILIKGHFIVNCLS